MNAARNVQGLFAIMLFLATLFGSAWAQPGQMGPGMMSGDRDDYRWGPGMMGPGMMGPGMMGPGMMGGYRYGLRNILDLDDSQRKKIREIREELFQKQWDIMVRMRDEYAKMEDLFYADKRDPEKISQQQQRIDDLRRQMMVASVEAQNRVEALLTPEQKEKMRSQYGHGWMMW